ncbi:MAG: protein kinase domain-containing protein [Planctomycetota bacterium]|jgi:hypothetical protein
MPETPAEHVSEDAAALAEGRQLGPYTITGTIGSGGMGAVYRAHHPELGRDVAIKVLKPDIAADPELRKRFEREGRTAAKLADHPNIVGVHDVGVTGDICWFAMELVEGRSFEALIESGDLAVDQAVRLTEQAARAVHHGHQHGVIHRDLKPANIIVDASGVASEAAARARVTDYGLASRHKADAAVSKLTATGELLGTPHYMAPEQATGGAADARVDVYALGATLYHALGGAPPHDGDSMFEVLTSLVRTEPRPLAKLRRDLPRALCAVVNRALARDPRERYAGAEALADDLQRYLAGEPVEAEKVDLAAVGRRARRRAPLLLAVVAVAAAGGGLAWWGLSQPDVSDADVAAAKGETAAVNRTQVIASAWRELIRESGPDMLRLFDRWQGVKLDRDETARLLAAATGAAEAAAQRHAGAGSPAAWRALAGYLAGPPAAWLRPPDGLTVEAGDDPFPHLLQAMVHLARYARFAQTELSGGAQGADVEVHAPTADQMLEQSGAFAALQAARRSPHWSALDESLPIAQLAEASDLLGKRKHAEVVAALTPLFDDPLLGFDAALLASLSLSAQGRFAAAAARAEQAAGRGWVRGHMMASMAWFALAAQQTAQGKFDAAPYERAIEHTSAAAGIVANPTEPLATRGVIRMSLGDELARRGGDPGPLFAGALEDLNNVVHNNAGMAWARLSRARVHQRMGARIHQTGGNPEPHYRAAIADFEAAEGVSDEAEERDHARLERARSLCDLGQWQSMNGRDPREVTDAGLAIYAAFLARTDDPNRRMVRAKFVAQYSVWKAQNGLDGRAERALAKSDFAQIASARPKDAEPWFQRGDLLGRWARQTPAGRGPGGRGWLRDCEAAHGEALARDPDHLEALTGRGGARVDLGQTTRPLDGSGTALIREGIADLTRAHELDPKNREAVLFRAYGWMAVSRRPAKNAEEAREAWAAAAADFETLLQRHPGDLAIIQPLADGWVTFGLSRARLGESPVPYFSRRPPSSSACAPCAATCRSKRYRRWRSGATARRPWSAPSARRRTWTPSCRRTRNSCNSSPPPAVF